MYCVSVSQYLTYTIHKGSTYPRRWQQGSTTSATPTAFADGETGPGPARVQPHLLLDLYLLQCSGPSRRVRLCLRLAGLVDRK